MKITEVILKERPSHQIEIHDVAEFFANYIKNEYIPWAIFQMRSGNSVSEESNTEIAVEYNILLGKNSRKLEAMDEEGMISYSDYKFLVSDGGMSAMLKEHGIKIESELNDSLAYSDLYLIPIDISGNDAQMDLGGNATISISTFAFMKDGKVNLKILKSLLAHEIRHALDDHLSSGNMSSSHKDVEGDDYLKDQYEANARFTQVTNELIKRLNKAKTNNEEYNKQNYMKYAKKLFSQFSLKNKKGHLANSDKQYKRFYGRAMSLYDQILGDSDDTQGN